jgi:hypothetical protein
LSQSINQADQHDFEKIKKIFRKRFTIDGTAEYYVSWRNKPAKCHNCWIPESDLNADSMRYVKGHKLPVIGKYRERIPDTIAESESEAESDPVANVLKNPFREHDYHDDGTDTESLTWDDDDVLPHYSNINVGQFDIVTQSESDMDSDTDIEDLTPSTSKQQLLFTPFQSPGTSPEASDTEETKTDVDHNHSDDIDDTILFRAGLGPEISVSDDSNTDEVTFLEPPQGSSTPVKQDVKPPIVKSVRFADESSVQQVRTLKKAMKKLRKSCK